LANWGEMDDATAEKVLTIKTKIDIQFFKNFSASGINLNKAFTGAFIVKLVSSFNSFSKNNFSMEIFCQHQIYKRYISYYV
jgi:hypothetical protein